MGRYRIAVAHAPDEWSVTCPHCQHELDMGNGEELVELAGTEEPYACPNCEKRFRIDVSNYTGG